MDTTQSWKATHHVTLRDRDNGEILCDADSGDMESGESDSGNLLYDVPVMMSDDGSKAYQECEWKPGAQMGVPDIMRDPYQDLWKRDPFGQDLNRGWTYKMLPVFAKFEPAAFEAARAGKFRELRESAAPWRDASGKDRVDIHYVATWVDENGVKQRYELSGTEKDEIVKQFGVSVRGLDADLISMSDDEDDEPRSIYGV
jgi:hypothetical protein